MTRYPLSPAAFVVVVRQNFLEDDRCLTKKGRNLAHPAALPLECIFPLFLHAFMEANVPDSGPLGPDPLVFALLNSETLLRFLSIQAMV